MTATDHQAADLAHLATLFEAADLGPLELTLVPKLKADDKEIIQIKMAPSPDMGHKLQRWVEALDIDHVHAAAPDDAASQLELVLAGFTEAGVRLLVVAVYDRSTYPEAVALILEALKRDDIAALFTRLAELDTSLAP